MGSLPFPTVIDWAVADASGAVVGAIVGGLLVASVLFVVARIVR